MRPARLYLALLLAVLPGLPACSTARFYAQAIHGQAEILRKARPNPAVLRDPQTPASVRHKLIVTGAARRFARTDLGLPGERQYDRYTDLGRRYVSWVVYAAPEFSTAGKTWWYPLLGSLEYRGFFSKTAAEEEAARLRTQGWETYVGGVGAYSTLGWFRDPVLNTFLHRPDAELAELLFHELTHVQLFLPGDTEFNEAFATANAEEGVRRWLRSRGDRPGLVRYEATLTRDRQIIQFLLATRQELTALYARPSRDPAELRLAKAAVFRKMRRTFARIRAAWPHDSRLDRALPKPWNNARLNTVATYYTLVPGFQRLLKEQHGDLSHFYAAVAKMRSLTKDQRRTLLLTD